MSIHDNLRMLTMQLIMVHKKLRMPTVQLIVGQMMGQMQTMLVQVLGI